MLKDYYLEIISSMQIFLYFYVDMESGNYFGDIFENKIATINWEAKGSILHKSSDSAVR